MGTRKETCLEEVWWLRAGSPALGSLSVPPGHEAQQPRGRRCLWKEATPEHRWLPTTQDMPNTGPQPNGAFEKALLWWSEQVKGSGASAASGSARTPSKRERSKNKKRPEELSPRERTLLHLSPGPSLRSSPSPRQTHCPPLLSKVMLATRARGKPQPA